MLTDLAMVLTWRGDFEAARAQCHRAQELDPGLYLPRFTIGWSYLQTGKFPDAIAKLRKAVAMDAPPWAGAWLGYAYGASGDHARAGEILDQWNERSPHQTVPAIAFAIVRLGIGDRERALDELERAYAAHSQLMVLLGMDRIFDSIRSEPRFVALAKKIGFGK